ASSRGNVDHPVIVPQAPPLKGGPPVVILDGDDVRSPHALEDLRTSNVYSVTIHLDRTLPAQRYAAPRPEPLRSQRLNGLIHRGERAHLLRFQEVRVLPLGPRSRATSRR